MQEKRYMVLIPCFNEQGRIGGVIRAVRNAVPNADVVVVNDSSADGSRDEAIAEGAVVLSHAFNIGYGAALETGYVYARENGYNTILQLDGDGQHPAEQLPELLRILESDSFDIVIGSRYADGGKPDVPLIRMLGHRLFSMMIRCLTTLKLTDPTSGFQVLGPKAIRLLSSGVFPCDYPDADVIIMAHYAGLEISEVPSTMVRATGGKSMHSGLKPIYYGIKMFLSVFIVMLNVRLWRQWKRRLAVERSDNK